MATGTNPLGENGDPRTKQLVAEIEKTRGELTTTVHAIEERLSPAHLKEQIKEQVRIGIDEAKTAIRTATVTRAENMYARTVDTIKTNPVPSALVGLGLAWLVMSRRNERRGHEYSHRVQEYGQRAQEYGRELAQGAKERTREVVQSARRIENRFEDSLRENPMAYAAIAMAVGTAVGLAIPRSRVEDQYLGKARDRLVEKAERSAHEALATLEPAPTKDPDGSPIT
jgi:ElaB/YqjD/DUF883 family membrane-anchored ribosome-binding protein